MLLTKEIFASLDSWGQHPVMTEITPGRPDISLNSDQFRERVDALAVALSKMGIRERTAVPLFLENSIDFPTTFLALNKLNAVPVMVKMDYRPVELTEIFRNLDPDVIISESYHLPVIKTWLENKTVIVRNGEGFQVSQSGGALSRSIEIPEDVASINYTYKGLGYPLGSMASYKQYLHGAEILQDGLQASAGESMLVVLPMSHIFTLIGCIAVPLMSKITSVISRTLNPRHLFSTISQHSVNHILAIPEIYELLSRIYRGDETLDSLKVFVSGGSYLAPDKYDEYSAKFGVDVLHGYGLTEFTPVSRNMRGESRPGTIGPLCNGVSCRIDDGEILLDTPFMTRGYYRRETETAHAFDNGLFKTGDLGHMENNHLVFDGEKKRTRKMNGNIVDLTEIENTIKSYPQTDQIRLDYKLGKLTAIVSFKNKNDSHKDILRDFLIDRIARYKVPRLITGEDI